MKDVLAVLLAGGAGERLHPLTRDRAKPAVPFGGIYRIVDVTLSNCLNSGCRRILVLVQYKSHSLTRHIQSSWNLFRPELGEVIEVIPPQQRVNSSWFLGTADAIYQNLYFIDQERPKEVLILSGDHIYKMDYMKMLEYHRGSGADLTIAAIAVPLNEAPRFGVLETDNDGRVVGFEEKPEDPKPMPGSEDMAYASMGIYVFNTDVLKRVTLADADSPGSSHDFGKDVIPKMIEQSGVFAYKFVDENKEGTHKEIQYWRDVGTIDAYWEANIDLVEVDPLFNLYDQAWPIRTSVPTLPPAKFVFAQEGRRFGVAIDSIVSPGSIVSGGIVKRSVLSTGVRVNSYSHIEESILMHGCSIGRHAHIRRAIVEKNVHVPEHAVIGYDLLEDAKRFRVTPSGIVVVESFDTAQNNGGRAK
ncbi:MAG: glucose-1-phosphate adenylyltransferase [Nitrospiraceae bacterium]|nr:glucose-1-phosphate adenylyltransferase [Nitrospiraceae bacterium]